MRETQTGPDVGELSATTRLAVPIVMATAGSQLLSLVDVFVAGRLGEHALAAVGLGQSIFFLVGIFAIGTLFGLDPLISKALGRGDRAATHRHLAAARRLAGWMVVPTTLVMGLVLDLSLRLIDFHPATGEATWGYLLARVVGLWPFLLMVAQRSMLQAWDRARPVATTMLLANVINLPLSALLAVGDGALAAAGLPAVGLGDGLGTTGIGLSTTVVVIFQWFWLQRAVSRLPEHPTGPQPRPPVSELWRLGWPIALQFGSEVSIFTGTTVLMGLFGETAVAGHQITFTVASLTFTVCLGISSATTVRVGLATGAGDRARARRAAVVGLLLGAAVMTCTATLFTLGGGSIARLFTDDGPVIDVAVVFFGIAGMFQLLDGMQVIGTAGLRGAGRTREAMVIGMIGYWGVGFPAALWLALGADLGPVGLWYGLVAGLGFSGPVAAFRLIRATRAR